MITLDARLYLERWLLTIKVAAGAAGLETHVRALDFKGGERLALEVRKGNDALEIRYRKRRTGPHMLAAATRAEVIGRVREVHTRVLAEHRKLLENGFRRFLRRSLRLLETLESALYRDAGLLQQATTLLREIPEAAGSRPAALVRRRRTAASRYEILPAAAVRHATNIRLVGLRERRLVDLCEFMPKQKMSRPAAQSQHDPNTDAPTPIESGAELLLVASDVLDSMHSPRTDIAFIAAHEPTAATNLAVDGIIPAGGSEAVELTEAGDIMAEAVTAASAVGAESASAAEVAVEVVSGAGTAAEALAETGSALSDAACAGIDCGGLDCIPI